MLSAVLSVILGYLFIPLLKKLKIGQTILSYVKEHKSKNGTPTMGGIMMLQTQAIASWHIWQRELTIPQLSDAN